MGFCSPNMNFILRSVRGKGVSIFGLHGGFCHCLTTMENLGEPFMSELTTCTLPDLCPGLC